jgi:hypothetical protein
VRLALNAVVQNAWDFVDVILLYTNHGRTRRFVVFFKASRNQPRFGYVTPIKDKKYNVSINIQA